MAKITVAGCVAGIVAWLAFVAGMSGSTACLKFSTCGRVDLIIFAIAAAGMAAPAGIVAVIVSAVFSSEED